MAAVDADIEGAAEQAVEASRERGGPVLDYSEASIAVVEEILAEAAEYASELSEDELRHMSQSFGCYVLEVGRRAHGGTYEWSEERDAPVLVTGEPSFQVAMLTWDKVRGRLGGDEADDIAFFYQGYAERVRKARPGDRVLMV